MVAVASAQNLLKIHNRQRALYTQGAANPSSDYRVFCDKLIAELEKLDPAATVEITGRQFFADAERPRRDLLPQGVVDGPVARHMRLSRFLPSLDNLPSHSAFPFGPLQSFVVSGIKIPVRRPQHLCRRASRLRVGRCRRQRRR